MLKSEKKETNLSFKDLEDLYLGISPQYKEEIEIEKKKKFQEALRIFNLQIEGEK
jgi:hypothetical protein